MLGGSEVGIVLSRYLVSVAVLSMDSCAFVLHTLISRQHGLVIHMYNSQRQPRKTVLIGCAALHLRSDGQLSETRSIFFYTACLPS